MNPLLEASLFLIDTAFTLFILFVLLRILLESVHADFYNPISQTTLKFTNFIVLPLRRFIPAYFGIDWASVLLLLCLALANQAIVIFLQTGIWVNFMGVLLLAIAEIFTFAFYIYLFAVLIIAVMSYLPSVPNNAWINIASEITAPALKQIRKYVPLVAGLDLSSLVFIVLLFLLNILVIQVIAQQGLALIIT